MAKYLKRDSEKGFVEDYVEIQSLKFNNIIHSVFGNMLGDFDDQGYYRVHPDIVKELIEMPKYVVEVMDNLEICLSTFKLDKQISFLVAYEGEKATLSLLEKVSYEGNNKLDGGTWSNVNEYVLDVVDTIGEIDRQALYIKWNIQTFPGEIVDIFNCEDSVLAKYFNIVTRFKYNLEAKTTLLKKEEELEEIEAEYFLDLFEILKDFPDFKVAVEKQIKQTLTEKKDFVKLDKPYFIKSLNEVVENAVEENLNVLSENQQAIFNSEKHNLKVKSNIKKYNTISIVSEKVEVENVQDLNSNVLIEVNEKIVTNKLETEDVKYKSFDYIVNEYTKTEGDISEKKKDFAKHILMANSDSKVAKVVDLLIKNGVAAATIVTAPLIDAFADAKTAKKEIEKSVKDVKLAAEKVVQPEKKPEVKKEEKKKLEKKQVEKKKEVKNSNNKQVNNKNQNNNKKDTAIVVGDATNLTRSSSKVDDEAEINTNLAKNKTLRAEKELNTKGSEDNNNEQQSNAKEKGLIGQRIEEKKQSLRVSPDLISREETSVNADNKKEVLVKVEKKKSVKTRNVVVERETAFIEVIEEMKNSI